jgi:hypothetical protein
MELVAELPVELVDESDDIVIILDPPDLEPEVDPAAIYRGETDPPPSPLLLTAVSVAVWVGLAVAARRVVLRRRAQG